MRNIHFNSNKLIVHVFIVLVCLVFSFHFCECVFLLFFFMFACFDPKKRKKKPLTLFFFFIFTKNTNKQPQPFYSHPQKMKTNDFQPLQCAFILFTIFLFIVLPFVEGDYLTEVFSKFVLFLSFFGVFFVLFYQIKCDHSYYRSTMLLKLFTHAY